MPPYHPMPPHDYHRYNHHQHHGYVRFPGPTVTPTTEKTIHDTTIEQESTLFNDIINNVHDIVNQQLGTTTETIDVQTEGESFINVHGIFNETLDVQPVTIVNQVIDDLNPVVTEIIDSVQENITPTFPYLFEDSTAIVDVQTTTEKAMVVNTESIMSTVRSIFENDLGPNIDHDHHHGHNPSPDKDSDHTYLILIIVLSILVVIAAVALFLYIRHKKLTRQLECSPISIVGKKFQEHSIFTSGEKPRQKSTKSVVNTDPKPSASGETKTKPSSMKDTTGTKIRAMESVEFEECPESQQKINPR